MAPPNNNFLLPINSIKSTPGTVIPTLTILAANELIKPETPALSKKLAPK